MDDHAEGSRTVSRGAALAEFATRAQLLARQSDVDAAAADVLGALATSGVEAILLKGAVLARLLYRPDEHRGYYDADLLVAPGDLAAAGRVLTDLGYRNVSEMRGVDDVAGVLHAEVWSRLVPGGGHMQIDLHWRLDGCEAAPGLIWSTLKARRAVIQLAGRQVSTLDRPGVALHLALHAAQHGPGDLKALGDLSRGVERWPRETWRQASQLAGDLEAREALGAGLRLVPRGTVLARELGLPAADALAWAIAHRATRPRGTFHLQAFSEARGVRKKLTIVRRSLLPTRAWIIWELPWAAGGRPRLIAAYGVHILRTPAWAARAWRFRRRAPRQTDP